MKSTRPSPLMRILPALFLAAWLLPGLAEGAQVHPKNVILLIADGCGSEHYTLTRWFKGAPLSLDGLLTGGVRTWIADSVVADSAPAATAYATGFRSSDKFISVGPREEALPCYGGPAPGLSYRPLATVLEGARLKGKATGLVCTSRLSHATPAAFMAHTPRRDAEEEIMEQGVYQGVDVLLGGGEGLLLPKDKGGSRTDGEDLMEVLRGRGYAVCRTEKELSEVREGKVIGVFAKGHLEAEIDRTAFGPGQPTLEAMTRKAIELLSRDPQGFFLMVEGSQVDWASHANDPAHLLSDLMMFDRAVAVALDFARRTGNTWVVAVSDHNTGGLSIGNYATSGTYSQMKTEGPAPGAKGPALLDPLRKMTLSASRVFSLMGEGMDPGLLRDLVARHWGISCTDGDLEKIWGLRERYKGREYYALGEVLCAAHTCLGWSTHGHTGGDVPLFAYGAGVPRGLLDAPDLGRALAGALGLDLASLNRRLFCDVAGAFPRERVDLDKADPRNPVLKIRTEKGTASLPIGKNVMLLEEKTHVLEGLVLYSQETDQAFVPDQAVRLLKGGKASPADPRP